MTQYRTTVRFRLKTLIESHKPPRKRINPHEIPTCNPTSEAVRGALFIVRLNNKTGRCQEGSERGRMERILRFEKGYKLEPSLDKQPTYICILLYSEQC